MKKSLIPIVLFFVLFSCRTAKAAEPPPNIIFFLADDLGYGEVGVYGQEKIKTPNIDALAESSMNFCIGSSRVIMDSKR